jgi:hypothetical protein
MAEDKFRKKVRQTIADATEGEGSGFVLLPTSAPYGRTISETTFRNYQIMVEGVQNF